MTPQTTAQLDADGYAEWMARDFALEPQGEKLELAGDKARFEREPHGWYCEGCPLCFDKTLDAEI